MMRHRGAEGQRETELPAKLISIIGPPAAGKTTLAEHLARELPAEMIREDYAGNPFLAESYAGSPQARFPAQLHFLMSRVGQLSVANWFGQGSVISDYGFCQDRIFARMRLGREEYRMYERVAGRLEGLVQPPDLLILLDASNETLLNRIDQRGRTFERVMDAAFLSAIRNACNEAAKAAACPVIRIDCDTIDLRQAAARKPIIEQVHMAWKT